MKHSAASALTSMRLIGARVQALPAIRYCEIKSSLLAKV